MAKSAGKKRNSVKLSGERIRFIVYILLALLCVVLFLIFGTKGTPLFTSRDAVSPTAIPEPTPLPKGVPMGRFIRELKSSGMACEFHGVEADADGGFICPILLPDEREGAALTMKTDAIGRVTECAIALPYLYAGEPDSSFSEITASAIKTEYRRREKADVELSKAFLESVFSQLSEDCGISTIDGKKIADAIQKAYYSQKTYDKKAGSARFYCETVSEDGFNFIFRIIASFDYSK